LERGLEDGGGLSGPILFYAIKLPCRAVGELVAEQSKPARLERWHQGKESERMEAMKYSYEAFDFARGFNWKKIYWGFCQMICFPKQWEGWLKKCEGIYGDRQKALSEEVELPKLDNEPTETKEV